MDGLDDFYSVGISAVVHQERGERKFDAGPESTRLQIIQRQQIGATLGSGGIVQAEFWIEVVFEDALHGMVEVVFGSCCGQADEARKPLAGDLIGHAKFVADFAIEKPAVETRA